MLRLSVRILSSPIGFFRTNLWTATCRQNLDVVTQSKTKVREMQLGWNVDTAAKLAPVHWSMYIVSIRPNASNWVPPVAGWTADAEYADMGRTNAPILNSGVFKVLWAKFMRTQPYEQSETTAVR